MRIVIEIDDKGAATTQVTPASTGALDRAAAALGGSATDAGAAPSGPDAAGATPAFADAAGQAAGAAPPL
jgi:hypothetical protein